MWSHFITTRTKVTQDNDHYFYVRIRKWQSAVRPYPTHFYASRISFLILGGQKIHTKSKFFTADSRFIVFGMLSGCFVEKKWRFINKRFLLKADNVYHTLRHRVMEGSNFQVTLAFDWNRTLCFCPERNILNAMLFRFRDGKAYVCIMVHLCHSL